MSMTRNILFSMKNFVPFRLSPRTVSASEVCIRKTLGDFFCSRDLCSRNQGKAFAREICARENKESFFCSYIPCAFCARQIFRRFALGIVMCEQDEMTFEDASFRVATCQAYEQVQ
jgi:hypothetical protein